MEYQNSTNFFKNNSIFFKMWLDHNAKHRVFSMTLLMLFKNAFDLKMTLKISFFCN